MKKLIFSAALVLSLGIAGCGEESAKDDNNKTPETQNAENASGEEKNEGAKSSADSNEVKNGPLTEAGQWTMDGEDKVTLVKIKDVNQTYEVGPLSLNIESIKLLQHSKPAQSTVDLIQNIHSKDVSAELNTIQVVYTIENTSDKNIIFTTIDKITTDTKAQIEGMHNIASNDDMGSYAGQVIIDGLAIFPYFMGSLEDIHSINIITGEVYDKDNFEKQGDSQKIEIAL